MTAIQRKPLVLMAGVGAVGTYFGGRLASSGLVDVRTVCRSDYDEVAANGYEIVSPNGDFRFCPDRVYRAAAECEVKPDYLIVTAKVLPQVDVPAMIAPAVGSDTVIVLIQNGIDIEHGVKEAFPANELISVVAYVGVTRTAPGKIVHTDGGLLKMGDYPSGLSSCCARLAEWFNGVGVKTECYADIQRVRWEKLVWNAAYNPVSVLARADTREITDDAEAVRLIRAIMGEVSALAAADGWSLPSDTADKMLRYTAGFRPYKPSMLADFENGRPMEIEAILGNALRIAERLNVKTPCLRSVYALIRLLQENQLNERGEHV